MKNILQLLSKTENSLSILVRDLKKKAEENLISLEVYERVDTIQDCLLNVSETLETLKEVSDEMD